MRAAATTSLNTNLSANAQPDMMCTYPTTELCPSNMTFLKQTPMASLLQFRQPVADRVAHDPGGGRDVELARRCCAIRFNRLDAEIEDHTDLFVGMAFGDELHDDAFAPRQHGDADLSRLGPQIGLDQLLRNLA